MRRNRNGDRVPRGGGGQQGRHGMRGRGRFFRGGGRGGQGRGRGRGRGGEPQVATVEPSYLVYYLNQYDCWRVMSYLTQEERVTLGKAYKRFVVKEQPNRSPQTQTEKADAKTDKSNEKGSTAPASNHDSIEDSKTKEIVAEDAHAQTTEPTDDKHAAALASSLDTTAEEKPTGDTLEETVKEDPLPDEAKADENQATKEEEKKESDKSASTSKANPSVSDPHTLLARLNSKRLYRRIKYFKKENKDFDTKDAYAMNKTTEEIAILEWESLLAQFKIRQIQAKKQQEQKVLQQEGSEENSEKLQQKEESKEDQEPQKNQQQETNELEAKLPLPIPSSCELLLFSPCPRAVAVLASYPRSGNSLLRNLYERTTLRVTGSDMRGGLTKHDLVGEMATQTSSVQFVKTHYPERRGAPPFQVSRAVLLVRNPYDAMESYFNLMMTNTHTTSLTEEQREKYAQVFATMAKKEILVWRDFHEYWLAQNIPLLVIRYEDLIRYTDIVIAKVIRFVLEINDMRFFESRIDRCIREEQIERLGSYRPRSGGIGKSLSKYSPELLTEINAGIFSTMEKFGYKEMLIPDPKQWELEPLDQYGVYIPGNAPQPLVINGPQLVRGPKRHTDWMAVRRTMNMENGARCTCQKCLRGGR